MRLTVIVSAICFIATGISACHGDEEFSLVIDPFSGTAALRNDSANPVELDSYYITWQSNPQLDTDAWQSLEDTAVSGWRETFSESGNRLGELNLFESLSIAANESVAIGSPYRPFAPNALGELEPGLGSIDFNYTLANESVSRRGDVEFSARNTVVLVVDPATGGASLQNQSSFDVQLDSYLVQSTFNALNAEAWSPLSGSDTAWASASGASNRIAEGNLFGSTMLPKDGGELSLGSPIDVSMLNDERDLILEFTTADLDEPISGGILFQVGGEPVPGDCNGDGVIDINDANCTPNDQLDGFLASLDPPTVRGDVDGDGDVGFNDFITLSSNFNQPGQYTDGDFNRSDQVEFADFILLSTNFGGAAPAAAVPEPGAAVAGWLVVGLLLRCRRSRR